MADANVTNIVLMICLQSISASTDLTEFDQLPHVGGNIAVSLSLPSLIVVIQLIEDCSKPIVAAVARRTLGGSLEVVLSCHYCMAGPKGVIPGAGRTQQLSLLVRLAMARQIILTGATISV